MSPPSDVVASAPRGSRFGLWNQRVAVAVLAGAPPLLLVGAAVGLVESDPAINWLALLLGVAVFAWVVYWVGFVFTLRLELTHSGQVRWFGALRQGSIDVSDIDRISTDAAPFLWTVHHARGRLVVAFVSDMKDFMRALDRLRSDDDSPPVSEHRSNESDS
jgi:hypothetical protein